MQLRPLATSIALWLLVFLVVVASIIKDANIYFNATLYMLIITLLVSIFGIILQQQNKIGELTGRMRSLEDLISEINTYLIKHRW